VRVTEYYEYYVVFTPDNKYNQEENLVRTIVWFMRI